MFDLCQIYITRENKLFEQRWTGRLGDQEGIGFHTNLSDYNYYYYIEKRNCKFWTIARLRGKFILKFQTAEVNYSSLVFQAVIFSSDDFGRDLPGVEALLRKHDDLERDLTVIESKMEALESEARRLARSQAHMVRAIQEKQTEIIENWERLNDLFDER